MRYVLSVFALFFSLSSFAAEPAQQNQAVRLSCVARVLNMDGSKAFYEQVPLKKIVDGRYAGPIDDYTLSIDVSNAPFVVLSLQFSARKGLDVQGVIEPSTGIGPELTYTLEPKASAPKIERYLEVGCGLEGRSVSFKSRQ